MFNVILTSTTTSPAASTNVVGLHETERNMAPFLKKLFKYFKPSGDLYMCHRL